MVAEHDGESSF